MNDFKIITPPEGHRFGSKSLQRISTCHPDLQRLAFELDMWWECSVPQYGGHRDEDAQNKLFHEGRSTKKWPNSRHNSYPSQALDICPWYSDVKIPWDDVEIFRAWGGFVLGISKELGIELIWGGDWDRDWRFKDQRFVDMPHFQLVEVT